MIDHDDLPLCRERGEIILTVSLTKSQQLSANGSQWTTSQGARAMRNKVKNTLKEIGYTVARNHINHTTGFTAFTRFDITYLIRYPTRAAADPDNLAPTLKPIIDGCTRAGLWPDDSSKYMRSRTYRQSTRTSGQRGIWAIEIHITPLTEEES